MDIRTKLIFALVASSLLSMALLGWFTYALARDLFVADAGRQLTVVAAAKALQVDLLLERWQDQAQAQDTGATANQWRANLAAGDDVELQLLDSGSGLVQLSVSARELGASLVNRTDLGHPDQVVLVTRSWRQAGSDQPDAVSHNLLLVNLATGKGSVVQAPDPPVVGEHNATAGFDGQLLATAPGQLRRGQLADRAVVATQANLAPPAWRLLVAEDQNRVMSDVDQVLVKIRDLGWSLGALVIVAGALFGSWLARPIRTLAETVDRIRHGELSLRASVVGEDELALLASSLNEFLDQLNRSSDIFQLGGLRVLLVVADDTSIRRLTDLLTTWRMQPLAVSNTAEALAAVAAGERIDAPVQLILADSRVTGPTPGRDVLPGGGRAACPVVLLNHEPVAPDPDTLAAAGLAAVLPAPVVASDLMETILALCGVAPDAMGAMPDMLLPPVESRQVLLVEDSPILARVTMGFLQQWGHDVTLVVDGQAAVDCCARQSFDLVLMDIEMPRLNGLDATKAIRAGETGDQRTPVVALTARATADDRKICLAAGMDEVVAKPMDPKVLYRLLQTCPDKCNADTADAATDREQTMTSDSPIDWQVAQKLTGGDPTLLADLAAMFPDESQRHLASLATGLETGDAPLVTRSAHSLKSAAGFFGATALVAEALQIEQLGRDGALDEAQQHQAKLQQETDRLLAALVAEPPPGAPVAG